MKITGRAVSSPGPARGLGSPGSVRCPSGTERPASKATPRADHLAGVLHRTGFSGRPGPPPAAAAEMHPTDQGADRGGGPTP
ncbi:MULTISPECIES: hypothetical protein [unclassified Streptomyces]|uniref:hypothetical protein n=1 Tax=unclassified Streptomyces TaxID=2593676 RepID=UPI003D91F598